jgi:hypothetical protein
VTHKYLIRFVDGTEVEMTGTSELHASRRAADLYGKTVLAWKHAPVHVTTVHHSQILG